MKKLILIGITAFFGLSIKALASDDDSFWGWISTFERTKGVRAVSNETFREECGACHFAYPPGLLPSQSWVKLLSAEQLTDHFGENAELDEETLSEIVTYVVDNSAEKSYYKRSKKITRSVKDGDYPMRITQTKYIRRKHHEIPEKLIKGNEEVNSLSYCDSCHTKAEKGIFDDDTVRIPGYGRWDD